MALLGLAIPGEVGLRLLFSPICSNIVIRTACCTVGTVLPVYSTFKSIERSDQQERDKWLVYWAAYGSFSLVEVFSDKLISWKKASLKLPTHNGASHLYKRHIRPFLLRRQARLDGILNRASTEAAKFLVAHQSEIQLIKSLIIKGATTANHVLGDIGLFQSPPAEDADSDADTSS